jgi:hypothetical protein
MFNIVKSLVTVLIVSGLIATCSNYFFNSPYLGVFVLSTIIQIAASWYITTYTQFRQRQAVLNQQTELISQIETEGTTAPCAYCGGENLIPISSDGDNDFECIHCGETNGVYVSITIAQKTVPVDAQPYEVSNHNSSLQPNHDKIVKP